MNSSGSGVLPTETMALLVCDAADSPRLPEFEPGQPAGRAARMDRTLTGVITAHHGGRLREQGDRDRFVVAFARVSDAVACAVALQRAPLAPIRLRIGVHIGAVSSAERGKDPGPAIDRAARLCEVANGGQTLLSEDTEQLVADLLPPDAWLTDLGAYVLRGAAYPERMVQLCHRDLVNDFPPLRTHEAVAGGLPSQLTSFVGRAVERADLRRLVCDHRLVTVTGTGGVGKTRLALALAGELADEFAAGVWWVDLAPITDPDLVALRVARTLGLPDQPGRSATDTVVRFIGDGRMLMVLDNCEHLRDACASLMTTLLSTCARLRIVATSREPLGVVGEVTWRTPPLSPADEAVELFTQRARLVRPDFAVTGDNATTVAQICRRLDGLPLAIELAATRVRMLSLSEIINGLGERFGLLNGGARTGVAHQQTLRASVDWSHALLSEPEQVVFRRLAVFAGGFDLDAAHAVAGDAGAPRDRIIDELAQLVDKSLVVVEHTGDTTRYTMLETIRQYAAEKLDESGQADALRTRHRDYYNVVATEVWTGPRWRTEKAEIELDNFRAAFTFSRRRGDVELAAQLASVLQQLWFRGCATEGLAWFDLVLADSSTGTAALAPATHARALADKVSLEALNGIYSHRDQAQQAVTIARALDDPALLARALTACGFAFLPSPDAALPYVREAIELVCALGDDDRSGQLLSMQVYSALLAGDLAAVRTIAEKWRSLSDAASEGLPLFCRWLLG
ncbi:MAG TPA: NB-ARC domain-containing protein, partial [Mycobacterium sp.]|nr:NB-ARC domain-containing protein [Mycobacterium sp.]